jgi:hypothetical protein
MSVTVRAHPPQCRLLPVPGPHCLLPAPSFLQIGRHRRRNSTRNSHPPARIQPRTAVLSHACSVRARQARQLLRGRKGRGRGGERTCRSRPWRVATGPSVAALASWVFLLAADRAARLRVVVGRGRLPENCGAAGWTGAARRLRTPRARCCSSLRAALARRPRPPCPCPCVGVCHYSVSQCVVFLFFVSV